MGQKGSKLVPCGRHEELDVVTGVSAFRAEEATVISAAFPPNSSARVAAPTLGEVSSAAASTSAAESPRPSAAAILAVPSPDLGQDGGVGKVPPAAGSVDPAAGDDEEACWGGGGAGVVRVAAPHRTVAAACRVRAAADAEEGRGGRRGVLHRNKDQVTISEFCPILPHVYLTCPLSVLLSSVATLSLDMLAAGSLCQCPNSPGFSFLSSEEVRNSSSHFRRRHRRLIFFPYWSFLFQTHWDFCAALQNGMEN